MTDRTNLDKCKCSFHVRMVGDGCQYCNPEFYSRYEDPQPGDEFVPTEELKK